MEIQEKWPQRTTMGERDFLGALPPSCGPFENYSRKLKTPPPPWCGSGSLTALSWLPLS